MSEELQVLKTVTGRLDAAAVPYMVTGSMALNYYAVPRMTRDIDIVVEASAGDVDRLCELFRDDFYLEADAVREAVERHGVFNLIHAGLVLKVDVIVRKEAEYRRTEFGRRRQVSLEGHAFWVVAPEDLVLSKLDWAKESRSEVQLCTQPAAVGVTTGPGLSRALGSAARARSPLPGDRKLRDTPGAVDAKYRAMLLACSGETRLKMAGSMYATARALVVASILESDPGISPAGLRQALFRRFYGHEFDSGASERILVRLGAAGATEPPGKTAGSDPLEPRRRRVAIDWDDLEMALTWRMDEVESFLDLRTGQVRQCRLERFGGEPEDDELSEDEADAGLVEGYLVRVEALSSSVEWDWMAEFAGSVPDRRLRDRFETALRGRGAFRRFKDVLERHPRERERWFQFHDLRVREAMLEWLADNEIEPASPPPEPSR